MGLELALSSNFSMSRLLVCKPMNLDSENNNKTATVVEKTWYLFPSHHTPNRALSLVIMIHISYIADTYIHTLIRRSTLF